MGQTNERRAVRCCVDGRSKLRFGEPVSPGAAASYSPCAAAGSHADGGPGMLRKGSSRDGRGRGAQLSSAQGSHAQREEMQVQRKVRGRWGDAVLDVALRRAGQGRAVLRGREGVQTSKCGSCSETGQDASEIDVLSQAGAFGSAKQALEAGGWLGRVTRTIAAPARDLRQVRGIVSQSAR